MKKILLFWILVVLLLIPFNFAIFLEDEQDISVTGSSFLENISEQRLALYERLDRNALKYYGYIVELKSEPLIVYKNRFEKTLRNLEERYNSLSREEKSSLSGRILRAQISAYKKTLKQRIKAYMNFLKEEHESVKDFSLSNIGESPKQPKAEIIGYEYFRVFNGFYADISERKAKELEKHPLVKKVHKNYEVKALLMDSVPLIGANQVWQLTDDSGLNVTGKGVTIAIIDTGVDYTHPDLGACTREQFLAGECGKVIGGYDFVNNDSDPMDDHGHGTHCASIAAGNGTLKGVAPDAKILAYKVLNEHGYGLFSTVMAGIEHAVDPNNDGNFSDHADVISMSLGGPGDPDDPVSQAVNRAVEAGSVVVVAAGNDGPYPQTIHTPGCAKKAITVGATYKKNYEGVYWEQENPGVDEVTSFSSRGPVVWEGGYLIKPDIVAPGAIICAARYDEIDLTGHNPNYTTCVDEKHIQLAGTSMSTPIVAGAAALLLQKHPDWSPREIKAVLKQTAKDLNLDPNIQGCGRIDVFKAVRMENKPLVAEISTWGVVYGTANITGFAEGDGFLSYTLEITPADNNSYTWNLLKQSTTPVHDGILATIDTLDYPDGIYILKLTVKNTYGKNITDYSSIHIENVFINKMNICEKEFTHELIIGDNYIIANRNFYITGNANIKNFDHYIIEYGEGFSPQSYTDYGITLSNEGKIPVYNDVLATIDASKLQNGLYTFRLRVFDKQRDFIEEDIWHTLINKNVTSGWPLSLTSICKEYGLVCNGAPSEVKLADLDNDGKDEIVLAFWSLLTTEGAIFVFRGDGSVLEGWPLKLKGQKKNPLSLAIADLDGDLKKEIVFGTFGGELHIVKHNGTYLEGYPKLVADEEMIYYIGIEDLDLDNVPEIILLTVKPNHTEGKLHVFTPNGAEKIGWPKDVLPTSMVFPSIGNIQGGEMKEIVFYLPKVGSKYKLAAFDYQGNMCLGWPLEIDGSYPFILADIDGDGQEEVIFSYLYSNDDQNEDRTKAFSVVESDGKIAKTCSISQEIPITSVSSTAAGDVDGDGKLEIVKFARPQLIAMKSDCTLLRGFPLAFDLADYKFGPRTAAPDILLIGDTFSSPGSEIFFHGGFYCPAKSCCFTKLNIADSQGNILESKLLPGIALLNKNNALGDVDGDGDVEYVIPTVLLKWTDFETIINILDLPKKGVLDWPQDLHDERNTNRFTKSILENYCSDGTPYGKCSTNKPYYCQNGNLVAKCSVCGCPEDYKCDATTEKCYPGEYETFTLHLINNWNYVSVPLEDANLTLRKLKEECDVYHIFYYDPYKGYQFISYADNPDYVLEPGVGYAIRAYRDCNIVLQGNPWSFEPVKLDANKSYLIGAPYEEASVEDILGTCSLDKLTVVYIDYSSGEEERFEVSVLEPGKSYFIRSTENCTFGTSPGPSPCVPKTCEELGWECGSGIEPKCNTEIDCGSCEEGYKCQEHKCVPTGTTFTLHLIKNWNYISVPLENANLTLQRLYEECGIYYVYYWDSEFKGYRVKLYSKEPDYLLEPGVGYIVKPDRACSIELSGTPWRMSSIELESGRSYLIGAPYGEVSIEEIKGTCDLDKLDIVYVDYSSGSEERRKVRVLEPGKAYWVQSAKDCMLGS